MARTPSKELELIENARRRQFALRARLEKRSYMDIASELGVSPSTVRLWVKEATVTFLPQDDADALRAQEAANIDRDEARAQSILEMLREQGKNWVAERKDVTAVLAEIRQWQAMIQNLRLERAKLLGLNSPILVQHNLTVRTEFDAEIEALAAELAGGGNLMSTPEDVLVDE